jgi:hypothetical protein
VKQGESSRTNEPPKSKVVVGLHEREREKTSSLLGVERGETSEVEAMDPSRRGGVESHFPELHMLDHELV